MGNFGYRSGRNNFRFMVVLIVLLILCILVAGMLIKELTGDFTDKNPGTQDQVTMTDNDDENDAEQEEEQGNPEEEDEEDDCPVDINDDDGKIVIVIDAGHDSYHVGANGNGQDEEVLVLTIAKYCYEELSKYKDVEVYMTRTSADCPDDGKSYEGTATQCNASRIEFADSVDADVLVSLHLNALDDPSFGGAIVYYPNDNYVPQFHEQGEELAGLIMGNLVRLGLKDRGIRTYDSQDGSLYPDNSLADYYGMIRGSKQHGILGIIVEHAYLTCAEDVEDFLSTEGKLRALGIADAQAIAEYYGLEK